MAAIQRVLRCEADNILQYWYGSSYPHELKTRELWFKKDTQVDNEIRMKFGSLVNDLIEMNTNTLLPLLHDNEVKVKLAAVLCLDQFTRNIFRGSPKSFDGDVSASAFVKETLDRGVDEIRALHFFEQSFFYIPLMHSEKKEDHVLAEQMYQELVDHCKDEGAAKMAANFLAFERDHKKIIDQFGRYPHRNEVLGRESTPEEIEFLKQPNSSF